MTGLNTPLDGFAGAREGVGYVDDTAGSPYGGDRRFPQPYCTPLTAKKGLPVKIKLTETITYAGDGDLQSFYDYYDAEDQMVSWAETLQGFYLAHLHATFPAAIAEVATPIDLDPNALHDELTVLLVWDAESPAGDGPTGFKDVTDESRGMCYEVRCAAWEAWYSTHPPDETP
jgi:hypothetical protein